MPDNKQSYTHDSDDRRFKTPMSTNEPLPKTNISDSIEKLPNLKSLKTETNSEEFA